MIQNLQGRRVGYGGVVSIPWGSKDKRLTGQKIAAGLVFLETSALVWAVGMSRGLEIRASTYG